jgi:hypothetical protein
VFAGAVTKRFGSAVARDVQQGHEARAGDGDASGGGPASRGDGGEPR